VQAVGGLADTVVDATEANLAEGGATGFVFTQPSLPALVQALERAATLFADPERWRRAQRYAMGRDFSWTSSAKRYAELYRLATPASRLVA
jgi:starch synthase